MTDSSPSITSQELFKSGMQLLASTVTLITSAIGERRAGMAATAVTSLAADPPSLLVCAQRTSRTHGFIMDSRKFAVNLVPDSCPEIVEVFASKGDPEEQFLAVGTWNRADNGMPILAEAVASFSCRVRDWANTKTHTVFFGIVEDVQVRPETSPLIYARQSFHRIKHIGSSP